MHGCPPDEIESICRYLMRERGLHTFVKCNPTLLGPERVRTILNDDLNYTDVVVPDSAFGHDLKYEDAIPLLSNLRTTATGLRPGIRRQAEQHARSGELPARIRREREDDVSLRPPLARDHGNPGRDAGRRFRRRSAHVIFSRGGLLQCPDALLGAGMQTITVCSDLLKTGGYLRLLQYLESTRNAFEAPGLPVSMNSFSNPRVLKPFPEIKFRQLPVSTCAAMQNSTTQDRMLKKGTYFTHRAARLPASWVCSTASKPPALDGCPVNQQVPQYMQAVREGDFSRAIQLTRMPTTPSHPFSAGSVTTLCEPVCIRTHLDEPLAIRHIKRFIMEQEEAPVVENQAKAHG